MKGRLELAVLAALAAGFLGWFAWPMLWRISANQRILATFSMDELRHFSILQHALRDPWLEVRIGSYGHLYFNLTLVPLLVLRQFGPLSEQCVIVAPRAVSLAFAVATVAMVFVLARRWYGRAAGWLAAGLIATASPTFAIWTAASHPDVPQTFFFALAAYFACRLAAEGGRKWLLAASVAAALAFACKYSGAFLLPVLWAVAIVQPLWRPGGDSTDDITGLARKLLAVLFLPIGAISFLGTGRGTFSLGVCVASGLVLVLLSRAIPRAAARWPRLTRGACRVLVSLVVFTLAFLLTSPYSFKDWSFVRGIIHESRNIAYQGGSFDLGTRLRWLDTLVGGRPVTPLVLGLAALSLLPLAVGLCREGRRRLLRADGVLWAVVGLFLVYLVLKVRVRADRYLLPLVPLLIVLSVRTIVLCLGWVSERWPGKPAAGVACLACAALAAAVLPEASARMAGMRGEARTMEEKSLSVKAGRWLAEHYDPSVRILCDRYSYIPPSFRSVRSVFGATLRLLATFDPDVVVVHEEIASRFADLDDAGDYPGGQAGFAERRQYYEALAAGRTGYVLAHNFGRVQVYERKGTPRRP